MAFVIVFIVLCSCYSIAHGSDEQSFVVVPTSSSEPETACSTASVNLERSQGRVSMPLVHRHGPCAPWQPAEKPSLAETLRRNRARWSYIMSEASMDTINKNTTRHGEKAAALMPTHLGNYVLTVGFGTPAVQQTLLLDTGSSLSWIQCKPCDACSPQKDPLFDPTKSSTYASVPCTSDACKRLGDSDGTGCINNGTTTGPSLCRYGIRYGGGHTTVGLYSTETLTLRPGVTVNNFSFGCGLHQRGQSSDRFDGVFGLGGAPESLVSQTVTQYGRVFSYCLPPPNGTAGFVALGAPSSNAGDYVFVPMHRFPGMPAFYMVTLAGISVGGKQLDIPPAVFSSGMIIDSGTVITGLPVTAYSALRTSFRSAMSAYPLLPPNDELDTCYNFTGHSNVTVPKVALTFSGGATIDLDVSSGLLVEDCLAFVGGSLDNGIGILGNVNQRTFEVLFDTRRRRVGFRANAC